MATAKKAATEAKERKVRLPHGDGTIYKRKDGLLVWQLETGYGPDGKRQRRKVTARSMPVLREKMKAVRADLERGVTAPPARLTVGKYLEEWIDATEQSGSIKPSTVDSYRGHITRYLVPNLGRIQLGKLQPEHVERLLAKMQADGLSANTRRLTRATLRRALGVAERRGHLARNVAALAQGPKVEHTRATEVLNAEQCAALVTGAADSWLEVYVLFGLTLGLRGGEILGLRWDDLDLDACAVTITGTLIRTKSRGLYRSTPKNAHSVRKLHLSETLVSALKSHKRRQPQRRWRTATGGSKVGYVFTSGIGTPIDPRNAWEEYRNLVKATLGKDEPVRPHRMRHTAATFALTEGAPLQYVSELLGHASTAITSKVYVHLRPEHLVDTALLLERTLTDALEQANKPKVIGGAR